MEAFFSDRRIYRTWNRHVIWGFVINKQMKLPANLLVFAICLITCNAFAQSKNGGLRYTFDTVVRTIEGDLTKAYTGGIDVLTFDGKNYVAYNYCGDNTIKIVNQSDQTFTSIFQPQENKQCRELNTRMDDKDYFVITLDNKVFQYCNKNPKPELFIDLMQIDNYKKSGLTVEWNKRGGDQHVNTPKDIIYFRVDQNYHDTLGVYSNIDSDYPAIAKLNLKTNQVDFFGITPYFVEHSEYGFLSEYYDLYVGDLIITSTAISPEIEVINTLTGTAIKKNVKSRFDTTPIEKIIYPKDKVDVNNVKFKHALKSPNYESLFYNPHTKYYYRIFHPAMDEYNEKGLLNTEYDKKCILMVINEKFELLDEVLLPIQKMTILKLYPTKGGVEIYLPELSNKTEQKSVLSYLQVNHFKNK